jgi:membrane associated rhomboid family serine protease
MIPLGTDAPIYHWPVATVGLIVVTVAASFAAWGLPPDEAQRWILTYGDGLHPLQWVTSNFVHGGIVHLIGNMIYLWGFGLIVEGKVGWWRFLAIYLGIGVAECALEQTIMLGAEEGGSLGASAIIFGLVAIGMVWAPRNEVNCVLILGWRVFYFEMPIVAFASIYFLFEGLTTVLSGLAFGSSVLHLFGVAIGFVLATVMLKLDWVDCEGWDLYTTRGSDKSRPKVTKAKARKAADMATRMEKRSDEALGNLRAAIDDGEALEALAAYRDLARMPQGWRPLEPDLLKLIALLQRKGMTAESVPIMGEYVERFPDRAARVRLKLAQVLIRDQQRPAAALKVLAPVTDAELPEDLRLVRRAIEQQARKLREEGVLELEGEPW